MLLSSASQFSLLFGSHYLFRLYCCSFAPVLLFTRILACHITSYHMGRHGSPLILIWYMTNLLLRWCLTKREITKDDVTKATILLEKHFCCSVRYSCLPRPASPIKIDSIRSVVNLSVPLYASCQYNAVHSLPPNPGPFFNFTSHSPVFFPLLCGLFRVHNWNKAMMTIR